MKKTWIIILVLAMMMTAIFATGCAEKDTPEPTAASDYAGLEGAAKVVENDDANFRGSAGMEGWQRASDLP